MLNHFQKLLLFFSLCSAPAIFTMQIYNDANQQSSYNPQANSELLQIINTISERLSTKENWKNIIKCLENGADPNIRNSKGFSSFFILLQILTKDPQNFDPEIFETLLQHNADPHLPLMCQTPDGQNYKITPLDLSIMVGSKKSVEILIKYGADVNAKSILCFSNSGAYRYYSATPLARAIVLNRHEIISTLCKSNASLLNINDVYGKTAFEWALKTLKKPEPIIKNLIVNARFQLPTTKKQLDSIALELLLILKHQFKSLQIPEDLKFRILLTLPAVQNWDEPDSTLYQVLLHKNYQNPYLIARLKFHTQQISALALLNRHEKTETIMSQLKNDIAMLSQFKYHKISPNNLAVQIYNNYKQLLEQQLQSSTGNYNA